MNPEVKALWLEALRSGEYEQGTGHLNAGGKFCCLGVLCEVAIEQGVALSTHSNTEFGYESYGERNHTSALPREVADWSGVGRLGELPRSVGEHHCLAFLNDDGMPFTEIADVIEKHL